MLDRIVRAIRLAKAERGLCEIVSLRLALLVAGRTEDFERLEPAFQELLGLYEELAYDSQARSEGACGQVTDGDV